MYQENIAPLGLSEQSSSMTSQSGSGTSGSSEMQREENEIKSKHFSGNEASVRMKKMALLLNWMPNINTKSANM